ncbi:hypothetical protein [Niveispirillum lacus]|uniref:hypothetical protein n=1 Tax=Niveispirillum lacus TaxID=1981099 RepID=UPI001054737C|nr:hypothetical protein [Niveispirillum lacus]
MSRMSLFAVLTLSSFAFSVSAQETGSPAQCNQVTNSAGITFLACKPDDGAAADIGPAEAIDADNLQIRASCAAPARTYTLLCPASSPEGSGCSCQDPNTGESVNGQVKKVGMDG